jgi:hypothetical protein
MKRTIKLCSLFFLIQSTVGLASVTQGNSAWVYDNLFSNTGKKIGFTAGLFSSKINEYNTLAGSKHALTQLFSYGGSMEMYCAGSGGTAASVVCDASNMFIYYQPGQASTNAYYNALTKSAIPVSIIPVVDGQLNLTGASDYLSAFNNLDEKTAIIFADKVATAYCADNQIAGVQFDLEPFDMTQPGQRYFYQQIAKDFAGKNQATGTDPLKCVDATHPNGRTFSVFTTAAKINPTVATAFNQYSNGYIIDSLYDLGPNAGGIANSPVNYGKYASREIVKLMLAAKTYGVKYQIGIPAAASVHEFETKNGVKSGYKQADYVAQAMNAINTNGVRNDARFMGIDLWSWKDKFFWNGMQFTPQVPSATVLNYLSTRL